MALRIYTPAERRGPDEADVDAYYARLESEWSALLATNPDEPTVHDFLEQHPALIPNVDDVFKCGHHGITSGILFSKPLLPSARSFIPDFMYIASDSACVYPVLIELEAPTKQHANADGTPNAKLTQARSQLADWQSWFNDPQNAAQFIRLYDLGRLMDVRQLRPKYMLIYGRREEVQANVRFARSRASQKQPDVEEMTYDRLCLSRTTGSPLVVQPDNSFPGESRFRVISAPPSVSWHAMNSVLGEKVVGIAEAVNAQAGLSQDRKAWLLSVERSARDYRASRA